jgi:hypothetical protein
MGLLDLVNIETRLDQRPWGNFRTSCGFPQVIHSCRPQMPSDADASRFGSPTSFIFAKFPVQTTLESRNKV